jgi:hypothetical protein
LCQEQGNAPRLRAFRRNEEVCDGLRE